MQLHFSVHYRNMTYVWESEWVHVLERDKGRDGEIQSVNQTGP